MLVVTVYETSKNVSSLYKSIGSKAVLHDFTCNIIHDFARDGRGRTNFDSFSKNSIKFGTWSLASLASEEVQFTSV